MRLESKASYNEGLFIFDIIHTPHGCGTWPALWLTDPANWPTNGEIDVVETNNKATDGNAVTLHTTDGCDMDVKRKMTGHAQFTTCLNSTNSNSGCGVQAPPSSYGEEMNQKGGGVRSPIIPYTLVYLSKQLIPLTYKFADLRPRTPQSRHPRVVLPPRLHPLRPAEKQ